MNQKSKQIVSLNNKNISAPKGVSTAIPEVDPIEQRLKNLTRFERLELEGNAKEKIVRRTLSEDYNKLKSKINNEDVVVKPKLSNRVLATIVDYIIVLFVFYISTEYLNLSSIELSSKPKTDLAHLVIKLLFSTSVACFVPTLLLRATLGKLIFGIKIRGLKYFNANVFQLFLREAISKPLAILSIFGVQAFFNNPDKVQLFEKISGTQAIKRE